MAGARQPRKQKAAPHRPLSSDELRRQAEERLDGLSADAAASPSSPGSAELAVTVHELRVHQIELEMQNDALARAQYETEEQRAKYLELFDLASVGQLVLTDEGLVRDANLTAARALNVERRQLVGKPFSAFVCASDQDAYYLYRRLLEKTREPQSCELRLEPVGAEPVWAHVESRPQGAADGEPGRSYVGLVDVPERVLAEERLRLSREHHSALVENVNVVTFTLDRQGTFTFVSPAIERLLGYTSAEMEGMPFSRFVHPDDRGALAERMQLNTMDCAAGLMFTRKTTAALPDELVIDVPGVTVTPFALTSAR